MRCSAIVSRLFDLPYLRFIAGSYSKGRNVTSTDSVDTDQVARIGLDFREQRIGRMPAQSRRTMAGVAHVLLHGIQVQVLTAEVARGELMAHAQLQVEPAHRVLEEARRLGDELVA